MRLSMENLLDDEEELPLPSPSPTYHLRKPITPYLCSTPDDFSEERNFLVEKVFPEVHEFCQLRGGHFFPVDIRWNSDDDQVCTGNMLKLCLDYICKCSPFMICMLGESYGPYRPVDWPKLPEKFKVLDEEADWKDRNYMMAAAAGYTWVLKETHQNTSITELEIIQATFLNENKHCYFYFRQPEHLDVKFGDMSPEIRSELSRVHLPENEYADLNIRDLKQRIVKKAMPVKYFQTLEELGRHVLKDWSAVIDTVYPPLEKPLTFYESEEYKDWVSNAMFADSLRQVFITSPELTSLMEEMTLFANSALNELDLEEEEKIIEKPVLYHKSTTKSVKAKYNSVMVLHGDRGSGKSTMISNWLQKYNKDNREVKVIHHYVGCSGRSKDVSVFLRKVIKELRQEFSEDPSNVGITDQNQPWSFQEVCQAFIAALSLGPTLIVLDGVDELGATLGITNRQIKEFKWLPFPLPPQCRLIFTTCRSDLSYHSLSLRHDAKLITMPMFDSEKIRISYVEEVMDIHYDNLTPSNKQQVLDIKLSTKPIFLSLLAVEMQAYSVYTDLTDYLDDIYEKVSSLRDLCTKCFHRWTQDLSWMKESLYGEVEVEEGNIDLEGWIPDTLRIMATSRTGLTVGDIFIILKDLGYRNTREVKMFDWLQFRETIGQFVYDQPNGLLQFGHQHLQEIVEYILLNSLKPGGSEVVTADNPEKEWKGQKRRFHGILAQYFSNQPLSQRVIEELPWHLLMSGDITQLLDLLVNPRYIEYFLDDSKLNQSNKLDLAFYWSVLKESGHSIVRKYEGLLQDLDIMERQWTPVQPSVVEADREESLHSRCSSIPVQDSPRETTLIIPKIITSGPRQRELSAVTEESNVYTPEGEQNREEINNVTHENVDENVDEDAKEEDEDVNTIFLTESESKSLEHGEESIKAETRRGSGPSSSSPREAGSITTPTVTTPPVNPVKIAWLLSQFLKDLGHVESSERILQSLNNYLMKNFPLEHEDMLTLAKVQEALGKYSSERGDTAMTEKYFRKSLRTVMDLYEMEETSPLYTELQNVKGRLLAHHGYLRLSEGMVDSAEDLLREGLECATDCGNITIKATILYNLGLLRMQQEDFVLAESFLRQALSLRERWYGKSHPLVANVLFHIAGIMGNTYNNRGFNRVRSENVYRKALKIREDCLGKDNITVSDTLFELGKLIMVSLTIIS
ncbi:hypothetical protein FSP39_001142 [Pinctada imbricata]|uniref:Nephrocystin 3-like N-terminal domain-containing protein n=1 Tax=Pinctada imbricata TaxID=66713 RepID=A0AA88YA22_PINIB|nr:hypothetical protein FSP39_001142 [Pinctada imbricata]